MVRVSSRSRWLEEADFWADVHRDLRGIHRDLVPPNEVLSTSTGRGQLINSFSAVSNFNGREVTFLRKVVGGKLRLAVN
jgi:hypothetical protein